MNTALTVVVIVVASILIIWGLLAAITNRVCKEDEKRRAEMSEDERRAADMAEYKHNQATHT